MFMDVWIMNMYGLIEIIIWLLIEEVKIDEGIVGIGKFIVNM